MEIIIPNLIRSLESVRQFANGEAEFSSGMEFMELHTINQKYLEQLSSEKNHPYFREKVSEYPPIDEKELNQYLRDKNNSGRLGYYSNGNKLWAALLIRLVYNLVNSSGKFSDATSSKLNEISSINENLVYVLRNPDMEDLIESSQKTRDTKISEINTPP
jgi:hypothetical protein